jgi:nitrate/TMAO reductase-like tetraheme cytochrome c subunit
MAACEWCWSRAWRRALSSGKSTSEEYRTLVDAQNAMGVHAECPDASSDAGEHGGES